MIKKLFFATLLLTLASNFSVSAQLKGDPWIFNAYKELYNRQPEPLELNIQNYNGGSWNNYPELKKYVVDFQTSKQQGNYKFSSVIVNNTTAVQAIYQNNQQIAVAALSVIGGKIIASDGASIISGGAGNIISGGAGNLIGQDGAGIAITKSMGGISFGSSNTLMSESIKVLKSGKGALIIMRRNK